MGRPLKSDTEARENAIMAIIAAPDYTPLNSTEMAKRIGVIRNTTASTLERMRKAGRVRLTNKYKWTLPA